MKESTISASLFKVKRILLLAFAFMTIGTLLELFLLEHFEDTWQSIPVLCIAVSMLVMLMLFFKKTRIITNLFKIVLVLSALSGFLGVYFHLNANFEFEQEMKPTANDWDLFVESLSGAFPALAPLSMIILALIGYSYLVLINQKR
jgi:amino acid permease